MNQQKPPQAMTLFDLIARRWTLDSPVRHVLFNRSASALSAILDDGRMAFVSVKDAESPEARVRVEADTGRASIRPRSKPLPQPVISEAPVAQGDVQFCQFGKQGFAFSHVETGRLWRATARGQTLTIKSSRDAPVSALAAIPRLSLIAVAYGDMLVLASEENGDEMGSVDLSHDIAAIAASANGQLLACWGGGRISVVDTDGMIIQMSLPCEKTLIDLAWSPCNRWLIAGCEEKAVLLVDVAAGKSDLIIDFPDAVRRVDFSTKAAAMITSGAFRVAGWTLPELPFGEHEGTPIETGKPGLMTVDLVATHPKRDLCAVSYANGLVLICRVAHPDEMLLREGTGIRVNSLAWTEDGAHLAIGDADGGVSIATFPKNMFK